MPNFKERSLAFHTVDDVLSIPDDCKDGHGSIETLKYKVKPLNDGGEDGQCHSEENDDVFCELCFPRSNQADSRLDGLLETILEEDELEDNSQTSSQLWDPFANVITNEDAYYYLKWKGGPWHTVRLMAHRRNSL